MTLFCIENKLIVITRVYRNSFDLFDNKNDN